MIRSGGQGCLVPDRLLPFVQTLKPLWALLEERVKIGGGKKKADWANFSFRIGGRNEISNLSRIVIPGILKGIVSKWGSNRASA